MGGKERKRKIYEKKIPYNKYIGKEEKKYRWKEKKNDMKRERRKKTTWTT